MKTQRRQVREDKKYSCEIRLEFCDLETEKSINEPAEGQLKITLDENVPYPVEVGIEDIEDENGDAKYVEFENRVQSVQESNDDPVVFRFTTTSSPEGGGKWYFYKTADWTREPNIDPYENPEFVKHHVGIPSAQKIHLLHRILDGVAGEETIAALTELYGENRTEAASEFSDDLKKYASFESRTRVQNFLIGKTRLHRSQSNTIDKVAKQLLKDEYRHRVDSVEDIEDMVRVINQQENFPDITTEAVFERVNERADEKTLELITQHLGKGDSSGVL